MDTSGSSLVSRLRPGARVLTHFTAVYVDSDGWPQPEPQSWRLELSSWAHAPDNRAAVVSEIRRADRRRVLVTDLGDLPPAGVTTEVLVACGRCDQRAVEGDPDGTGLGGLCVEHGGIPWYVRSHPECNRIRVEVNGIEPLPYPPRWEAYGRLHDPYACPPEPPVVPALDLELADRP